jgi:nucleotide-binding universal stress UspA family protein
MYQRILVPLDGSALSEAVLPYAEDLASRLGSAIHLVQVVPMLSQLIGLAGPSDVGATIPPQNLEVLLETTEHEAVRAEAYLEGIGESLRKQGLTATWEVRRGNAATEIIQCVHDRAIDTVAVSTRGRSGLGRLFFGSVASRVIRDAGVPVLVIKPEDNGAPES